MSTPVRRALLSSSSLLAEVRDGIDAIERSHRRHIDRAVRSTFADSLALDARLARQHSSEHRWDYLLGLEPSRTVVGLEPHSATTGQVGTLIAKRAAARAQLQPHLRPGAKVAAWYWVASGRVDFVPHDKQMMRLQQAGVTFVGGTLLAKHLPPIRA